MLTRALVKALESAERPAVIRAITWALEVRTGLPTERLLERKGTVSFAPGPLNMGSADDPLWYQQNGFYGIAGMLGSGYLSSSGILVRPENVLRCSAFLAGVKIISEDIGTMPFFPYEKSDQEQQQTRKVYGNLYEVLHDQPNPEMSAGEFREALTARAVIGLDGFARIERTTRGDVVLWPIGQVSHGGWINGTVRMTRNEAGQLFYVVKEGNQQERALPADQIFHLKGFTLDGWHGDDTLLRMRDVLGLTIAGQEYATRYFSQDATPGLIIKRPAGLPAMGEEDVQKWKTAWLRYFAGLRGKHAPAILQDGMDAVMVQPDHQKLQMLESRKFQVAEVARFLRMPLHKLADLDRSTNNNIEHQGIEYVTQCLGPWRRRWEDAVHCRLLTRDQKYWTTGRPRIYAELEEKALMRGDFVTQAEGLSKLMMTGVYSVDEVRALFNLNAVPDGKGQGHYVPLNMQDVVTAAKAAVADAGSAVASNAVRQLMVELMESKLLPAPQEVQQ